MVLLLSPLVLLFSKPNIIPNPFTSTLSLLPPSRKRGKNSKPFGLLLLLLLLLPFLLVRWTDRELRDQGTTAAAAAAAGAEAIASLPSPPPPPFHLCPFGGEGESVLLVLERLPCGACLSSSREGEGWRWVEVEPVSAKFS